MTDKQRRRKSTPDRARKRAIRAQAARADVPYSVAARQLDATRDHPDIPGSDVPPSAPNPGTDDILPTGAPADRETANRKARASRGRTVYPQGTDTHRQWLIECRERRTFAQRIQDARRAADLPSGRAQHLADRFPPTRGERGTGVGPLYHGEGRQDALALLFAVIAHETPGRVPSAGDLAWAAELGEETAVDIACAELDRAARWLLDTDRATLWPRIEAALAAGETHRDWRVSEEAVRLAAVYRAATVPYDWMDGEPVTIGLPLDGVRHILDAVLVVGDDGHSPGTRVQLLTEPYPGHPATIIGAIWGPTGPPCQYEIYPDAIPPAILADPHDLLILKPIA